MVGTPPPEQLRIEYISLPQLLLWERNPKKHDAGAIWRSIVEHGFKDPPKFEPKLNGGEGGIVEGNGRSQVLFQMKTAGEPPPRGILTQGDEWLVPVLFGVDATSERTAEAYGVDHNNLVMAGGDFAPWDIAKLWNPAEYAALLEDLAQNDALPASMDGDDLDKLIDSLIDTSTGGPKVPTKEFDESVAGEVKYCECPSCGHKFPK